MFFKNGIFSSESETSSESSSEEEDAEEDDVSSEEIEEEDEDNYEDEFDQDTLRNTIRNAKKTYNQRDLNICLGQICDSLKNCEGFKQFIELNIDINIQSISEKCQNEIYKNQEEFKGDFEKMFEILYFNNTRNSSIYQETMKMQRKFIQLYSQFDAKTRGIKNQFTFQRRL
ncbi:Bromodomain [Pseudocohnilembus persalinus]|uniref:Bromodomain n=1 Tax=Pseudocohnilembus persalinus TaxID=266149 RepID=A0A0V0QIE6_PSEPJ|nr:Bromodomain [Pseudocohnilembus persalinus]|eukprot:KRX02083.1 Bromodomain [Pseudocohnilembus persalinus]